jgi:hypothetical protein
VIPATVDIDPDTLNLNSSGKWITTYIELPAGHDVSGIDVSTVTLNGVVSAEQRPTAIGDHDHDNVPDLMVKFSRSAVQSMLSPGEVELTVAGKWNGELFSGSDVIRVIGHGRGNRFGFIFGT